jgi:hypothetical protein
MYKNAYPSNNYRMQDNKNPTGTDQNITKLNEYYEQNIRKILMRLL